jgi:hypothetical protein
MRAGAVGRIPVVLTTEPVLALARSGAPNEAREQPAPNSDASEPSSPPMAARVGLAQTGTANLRRAGCQHSRVVAGNNTCFTAGGGSADGLQQVRERRPPACGGDSHVEELACLCKVSSCARRERAASPSHPLPWEIASSKTLARPSQTRARVTM